MASFFGSKSVAKQVDDAASSNVTELVLHSKSIANQGPFELSIVDLSELTVLNLSCNKLVGMSFSFSLSLSLSALLFSRVHFF